MRFQVAGIRGDANFDTIISHFQSLGGDVVIMDPAKIVGRDHILSATMHAERSFSEGTNRSNSILTEIILYTAWERQIGKALSRMRPPEGSREYAIVAVDVEGLSLDSIGMERDDSILDPDDEKIRDLGLDDPFLHPEDQAVERVALMELQKL